MTVRAGAVPTLMLDDVGDVSVLAETLERAGVPIVRGFDNALPTGACATAGTLFRRSESEHEAMFGDTGHPFRGLRTFFDEAGRRCWRRLSIGRFDDVGGAREAGVDRRYWELFEAPNVWPQDDGARASLADFRSRAIDWSGRVVRTVVDGLELGAPDNTNLAVTEYDPFVDPRRRMVYFEGHTDLSALTFIVQAGAPGGLQVRVDGEGSEPITDPGDAFVLVGDWLDRASGGRLSAGVHRVLSTTEPRQSVVALVFPELCSSIHRGESAEPTTIDEGATIGEVLLGSVERYMAAAAPGEVGAWRERRAYRPLPSDGRPRGLVADVR